MKWLRNFFFMFIYFKASSIQWIPVLPWSTDYRYTEYQSTYVLQWRVNKEFPNASPRVKFLPYRFLQYSICYNICNLSLVQFYANFGDYVPPTFHTLRNLTHLRLLSGIDAEGFDLNLLSYFLECSPNIKVLVLQVCWKSITGLHLHLLTSNS